MCERTYVQVSVGGHGGTDDGMAVDFRGNPADKSRTGRWLGAGLILGTELAERVCVMGISMNLVTYLVGELHLSNAKSANIVTAIRTARNGGTWNAAGLSSTEARTTPSHNTTLGVLTGAEYSSVGGTGVNRSVTVCVRPTN